jgi:hypothetical protein
MGCDEFIVKMVMSSKDVVLTLHLTKMKRRNIPSGMFEKPDGNKRGQGRIMMIDSDIF